MLHLHRVASHSPKTGMTAKNLAIVWAPNLIREAGKEDENGNGKVGAKVYDASNKLNV